VHNVGKDLIKLQKITTGAGMMIRRFAAGSLVLAFAVSTGCKSRSDDASTSKSVQSQSIGPEEAASQIREMIREYYRAATDAQRIAVRDRFFTLAYDLQSSGKFKETLRQLLATAGRVFGKSTFGEMTEDQRNDLVNQLDLAIGSELEFRRPGSGYKPWNTVSGDMMSQVASVNFPPAGPGTPSRLNDEAFLQELSDLANAPFVSFSNARVLVNGPASFSERDRLIDGAKKRIWVSSWAFYDDETGKPFAEKLIAAKKRGIDVRVMVDGLTAKQKFADEAAKSMETGGVPVLFWLHKEKKYFGMHRKVMMVDSKAMIIGGMNFGNEYSHRGSTDPKKHWRDTDLYIEGGAVQQTEKMFAAAWNYGLNSHPAPGSLKPIMGAGGAAPVSSGPRMAIIDHEPAKGLNDTVYLATLKAIEGATQTVYVHNAYYIATPAIENALAAAARRGVRVVLITNSSDSVDVPSLIRPIYRGLPKLYKAGVEIYLHRGSTLHSKTMVVDRTFGWIGSYNLHPRSHRIDSEMVAAYADKTLGNSAATIFEEDMKKSQKVTDVKEVEIPAVFISDLAEAFFFDQL
jgi:cardiolipin synthase